MKNINQQTVADKINLAVDAEGLGQFTGHQKQSTKQKVPAFIRMQWILTKPVFALRNIKQC